MKSPQTTSLQKQTPINKCDSPCDRQKTTFTHGKNILKKWNSKWFLLFLCTFFSLTMQAQWDENQDLIDLINEFEELGGHVDYYDTVQDYIDVVNNDDDYSNDMEYREFIDPDLVGDIQNYDESTGNYEIYDHSNGWFPVDDGWGDFMQDYNDWVAQMEQEEQEALDEYYDSINDDEVPPEDNNGAVETPTPEPPVKGKWYLDNDGDGYDSGTDIAETSPGIGWKEGTSKGPDCNDDPQTGKLVHKLNKCGKCEVEPESTDWKISDVIDNATGLLKEMIVRAKLTAPNLTIIKSGNHQGAKTNVRCEEIKIGENAAEIKSNSLLAFELSHVLNTNLYTTTFRDGLLKTKAEYVKASALFEAEGFLFSQVIKNTEAKTLNDCEKNLLAISALKHDYSNLTVDQIKNQIRQNGELDSKAQDLIANGIVVSTGKTLVQKYEADYDRWQKLITWYRTVKKLSDTAIAKLLLPLDCN
ncbi:hypothetical protein C3L50_08160 [Flavobacterium alvei]|uniref:Uncharacterized protein n=1 Tax=Flavobacterium alvei TaxID=2080416 RepID=A0A2S5AB81_9FLAO|nr:hypothetical protein [Flavobacterium alvei]POY39794.1 hypothetical protein C3L50_08160 [Flavobacterium alvei]